MANTDMRRRLAMMLSKKDIKEDNILTFTAEADNSSVQLTAVGSPSAVTLEYNLNGGGWLPYTVGDIISLPNVGDNVKMRGNNATFSTSASNYYKFVITGYVAASGDVTSLQNEIGGDIALTQYCYYAMFNGCTGFIKAPFLPATTLAEECYYSMFNNCTAITSYDVATLNTSRYVFNNNSSSTSFTIHADTPPTINSTTIAGLKADCKIYVPYSADHSILDAYKTAQYWSDRADYIFELNENGEIPS